MIVQIFILGIWLLVIPTLMGGIAAAGMDVKHSMDKRTKNLPFLWTTGQILMWAVFQLVCVPLILMKKDFSDLVRLYQLLVYLLTAVAVILTIRRLRKRKRKRGFHVVSGQEDDNVRLYYFMWIVFFILLAFQVIMVFCMTYGDGDDAFYVAVATITEKSDTMYQTLPYTGGTTGLDVRHGLAPFPVWIAFLARVSGMRTVSVAHVAVPAVLIPMTYAIYYLIGRKLCGKRYKIRLPVFLVFTELLVLFGDYSHYSPENFMIARSRQGKAALGNIILPMMIFLLLLLLHRIQENQKIEIVLWILLMAVITAGCLCSTLAALLTCLLVGIVGLCAAVCYRKWKFLIPMALCCAPALGFTALYLVL